MARKPNYDFERKERERLKSAKKAARDLAKNPIDADKTENAGDGAAETEVAPKD